MWKNLSNFIKKNLSTEANLKIAANIIFFFHKKKTHKIATGSILNMRERRRPYVDGIVGLSGKIWPFAFITRKYSMALIGLLSNFRTNITLIKRTIQCNL